MPTRRGQECATIPSSCKKYGGACLETPAKIRAVASSLADLHSRGHRVVAIVSATGKTTDELVRMAYQVSAHPNRRELDMLLPAANSIMSRPSRERAQLICAGFNWQASAEGQQTLPSAISALAIFQSYLKNGLLH
jgi:aspartate kinase